MKTRRSFISIYMISWILILASIIVIKIFLFKHINLFWIYLIITGVPAAIVNGLEGHRLLKYIQKEHEESYEKIKTFNGIKGIHNGFEAFGYVFSSDDDSDETLMRLKSNYRKVILLLIILFFSYPIVSILLH